MKNYIKYIIAAVLFAAVIVVAVWGYGSLDKQYNTEGERTTAAETQDVSESETITETSVSVDSAAIISTSAADETINSTETKSATTTVASTKKAATTAKTTAKPTTTSFYATTRATTKATTKATTSAVKTTTKRYTTTRVTTTAIKPTTRRATTTVSEPTTTRRHTTTATTIYMPDTPTTAKTTTTTTTTKKVTTQAAKNPAADFTVYDKNGNKVKLSQKFGKPIVVNFWASWCGPCKSELPAFDSLYAEYGNDITFMMVNVENGDDDTVNDVKSFVSQAGYSFPVYYDKDGSASNAYSISSIPMTVFIRSDGTVMDTRIGSMEEATLRSYLNKLKGE